MSPCVDNKPVKAAPLSHFCNRMREKNANQKSCGPVVIVAFGDSVTMGSTTNGLFIPEEVYHSRLKKMLANKYPGPEGASLSVINSGIGGDTATSALRRIDRDVIRYQPDLVLVAFAANDLSRDAERALEFESSMRNIIQTIRAKTLADIILLTSTHMAGRENENTGDKGYLHILMQFQNEGVVAKYASIVRKIGHEENVPVADIYERWNELAASGVDTTSMLANGLNHPSARAHEIPAVEIYQIINSNFEALKPKQPI